MQVTIYLAAVKIPLTEKLGSEDQAYKHTHTQMDS